MSERVKRELTRDLIAGIARTGPVWRNMPVNACPDDDPIGEPRPLVATPVNDVSALIDHLLAAGWTKELR